VKMPRAEKKNNTHAALVMHSIVTDAIVDER